MSIHRRCPSCGLNVAAEFAAYNRGVIRSRNAYLNRRGAA